MYAKLMLGVVLATFVVTAQAGTGAFAYPNANGVVVAAPQGGWGVKICYYEDDVFDLNLPAQAQTIVPVWECDHIQTYGAAAPVWYFFKHTSPVKIIGARWAYALKKDYNHYNRDHHDLVRGVMNSGAEERRGGYVKRGNYDSHTFGFDAIPVERFE